MLYRVCAALRRCIVSAGCAQELAVGFIEDRELVVTLGFGTRTGPVPTTVIQRGWTRHQVTVLVLNLTSMSFTLSSRAARILNLVRSRILSRRLVTFETGRVDVDFTIIPPG